MTRTSNDRLSSHAWGTAFDINTLENKLGHIPAQPGDHGCVRELVGIANFHGFYWGGHFAKQDGMHFEVAVIQPASSPSLILPTGFMLAQNRTGRTPQG